MIGLPARITLFVAVAVPLLTVFYVEIEDQVFTWSSIFSCDPSPVDTTEVPIYDQKLRLVLGVSSVYLCQFVADVAFRRCSTRSWTVLESRCSLTSNLVRRSEGRHARIYGHSSSTWNTTPSKRMSCFMNHIRPPFRCKSGMCAGSFRSDHRCRISCSSSNRQRGCEVALHATTEAGKYRSWSCGERRVWLFFLILTV